MKCSRLSSAHPACPPSYVRLLHAAPDMPPVDVFVNGNLVAKNLAYKQFAGYFTVMPCIYHIKVYPSGKHAGKNGECALVESCFEICSKSATTIAIVGGVTGVLGIAEIYDPCRRMRDRCKAYVRFVNLSSNSPPLDVSIAGGLRLFESVAYTTHTQYVPVDPGTYQLQMKPAGSNQTGIVSQPINLAQSTASTVYAVGLVGGQPPLEAIASVDGNY